MHILEYEQIVQIVQIVVTLAGK